jgi:hypothetical protein
MEFMVVFAIVGLVVLAAFVWWVVGLVEAVRVPAPQWDAVGQSQLVHILLMVFLGVIGTLVYWLSARPALKRSGAL